MTRRTLTIGFVSLVRPTFDTVLAAEVAGAINAAVQRAGFTVMQAGAAISTVAQAQATAKTLAGQPLDLLIVCQSTFADSAMVLHLAQAVDAPLLLWAVPEAPNGERLRLNALCGMTLAAHALTRAGQRYTTIYAHPGDPAALETVRTTALAGRARRLLRTARVGRVGEPPPGFVTCRADTDALKRRLGVEIVPIALDDVFAQVRAVTPQTVDAVRAAWDARIAGLGALDQDGLRGTLASYAVLRDLAETHRLDGLAVRCWFQFVEQLGCAVCAAQCMLSDSLLPASCEADVNGNITQLILQWISGEPVFDSDIVSFDMDANTAVFWHCGKAPLSMADPDVTLRALDHFNFKRPMMLEFPLKPGRVTLARLSEASGDYRLVIGSGEVVRAPVSFSGTSGVVRFDRPAAEVLDTILGDGLEHHLALVYGDWTAPLLVLATMLDMPVLRLT